MSNQIYVSKIDGCLRKRQKLKHDQALHVIIKTLNVPIGIDLLQKYECHCF